MALQFDRATLQAALIGYQRQLQEIESRMTEIRRRLGRAPAAAPAAKAAPAGARRHHMSAEGRARIAAAQHARWARYKKANAA